MNQTDNQEPLRLVVSQRKAAEALDVCVDTIENMVARGQLERVNVTAKKYGITWRSLQKLIGNEVSA